MTGITQYNLDHPRFSRRWWVRRGRNFLWVALITILIWVFADMQLTQDRELIATIRLTAGEAADMVLLDEPDADDEYKEVPHKDVKVVFSAVGSRHSLDRFEHELKNPIPHDVAKAHTPGEIKIPTKDILNEFAGQVKAGLTFRAPEPNVITLRLDKRLRQVVPVELVLTGAELAEQPNVTMPITVAQALWDEILRRTTNPVLKTVTKDLKDQETDKPITVTFDIIPSIAGVPVHPQRRSKPITIQITQRTVPKTLTVTVRVLAPPSWVKDDTWSRYKVVGKEQGLEWRKQITVSGPKEDLDRLEARDVDAYIKLTEDDKAPVSWLPRTVIIRFPPGLAVNLVGEPPTVNFKLIERTDAPTP